MNDNVENLILEQLRRMDKRLVDIVEDVQHLKTRVSAVDEHLAGVMISLSGINNRMDRFDERMSRIERRLDLTDAK